MTFEKALELLKANKAVKRDIWAERAYIAVEFKNVRDMKPTIAMFNSDGVEVGWRPSWTDMTATDWVEYDWKRKKAIREDDKVEEDSSTTESANKMQRFCGLMPISEVEKSAKYADKNYGKILIEAGPRGWTVIFPDSSSSYRDNEATTEINFNEALENAREFIALDENGNLMELKEILEEA